MNIKCSPFIAHLLITKLLVQQSCLLKFCLFDLILYVPVNNLSVTSGRVVLGRTSTKLGLMCLVSRTQRSDVGEAQMRSPLVSSQALYH